MRVDGKRAVEERGSMYIKKNALVDGGGKHDKNLCVCAHAAARGGRRGGRLQLRVTQCRRLAKAATRSALLPRPALTINLRDSISSFGQLYHLHAIIVVFVTTSH